MKTVEGMVITVEHMAVLVKIADAADKLEAMLRRNCGSNDDWPISLKVSGDYAQELAGKLTALTRALKPYRNAKNDPSSTPPT